MNIYRVLKEDHKEAKTIFKKLSKTTDRAVKTRLDLFGKLKHALDAHSKAEEKVLYRAMREQKEARDEIKHAKKEHDKAEQQLKKLHKMKKDHKNWLPQLMELKESVEHHIKEEESDIFKHAKDIFSKEDARDMGKDFAKRKKQLLKIN